jgi:hypothetical protein
MAANVLTSRISRPGDDLIGAITALLVETDETSLLESVVDHAHRLFDPVVPRLVLQERSAALDGDDLEAIVTGAEQRCLVVPLRGRDGVHGTLLLERPPGRPVNALRHHAEQFGEHVGLNLERVRRAHP